MCRQTNSRTLLFLIATLVMALVAGAESQTEGPPQTTHTSEASLARNFYFIVDGSGSMSESLTKQCKGDKRFGSRLEGAKWAVEQFLPLVPREGAVSAGRRPTRSRCVRPGGRHQPRRLARWRCRRWSRARGRSG